MGMYIKLITQRKWSCTLYQIYPVDKNRGRAKVGRGKAPLLCDNCWLGVGSWGEPGPWGVLQCPCVRLKSLQAPQDRYIRHLNMELQAQEPTNWPPIIPLICLLIVGIFLVQAPLSGEGDRVQFWGENPSLIQVLIHKTLVVRETTGTHSQTR